jgi:hypothetical protein
MKAFAFILAIALPSSIITAQQFEFKLEKTTDKYGLNLKKGSPRAMALNAPGHLNLHPRNFSLNKRFAPLLPNRPYSQQDHANKWYVVPDTHKIARIPNALPYYTIPDIAAIPNPLLKHKRDIINSAPLK